MLSSSFCVKFLLFESLQIVVSDVVEWNARGVYPFAHNYTQFVFDNPRQDVGHILLHYWRDRANHPAVFRAMSHLFANGLCLFAIPNLVKCLDVVQITHCVKLARLLHTIARKNIAVWVDKEVFATSLTGKHSATTFYIIDKAKIEKGTEPRFWRVLLH